MKSPRKKRKKKLPKDILNQSDHEIMEVLLGKQTMKQVDRELVKESVKQDKWASNMKKV